MNLRKRMATNLKMFLFETHILQVVISSFYLVLGVYDPERVKNYWWLFAAVTFVLSVINIWKDWKKVDDDVAQKK